MSAAILPFARAFVCPGEPDCMADCEACCLRQAREAAIQHRPTDKTVITAEITFKVPPPSESPFLFRRALLNAIRTAISQAHVDGELDTEAVVRCLGALPMPGDK